MAAFRRTAFDVVLVDLWITCAENRHFFTTFDLKPKLMRLLNGKNHSDNMLLGHFYAVRDCDGQMDKTTVRQTDRHH